jgi:asparagine synthase (glutamine-hydrolysing)
MCGIAGILALKAGLRPPSIEQLRRMTGALRHRGPDEFGVYRSERVGLAHTRLSIIDLASGQQPLPNEDGTLWVVFNGEIYNYVELRAELERKGHRFRTRSDTEVIVHAFEEWGGDSFERYNGQFAIALWDTRAEALVLARDRLGVRPLYVCEHGGRMYFASEVKAIFAAEPSIPRELDPVGIEETFTFWTVVPPQTVFRGITEIPPGHVRTYTRGEVTTQCFYRLRYPEGDHASFPGSLEDAATAVRSALEEGTRLRMLRADVPVGSFLSGGLDSSLIAALGREVKGDRFCTFSLRFEDAEYDETGFQRAMVRQLGTDHREILVSRRDIARVFPDVVAHVERPILRTAPAPLYLLSKLVREAGIKVVLTGEGADEMFAGYDLFREGKIRRFWARQPSSKLRPRLLERLYPYLARSPVASRAIALQFFGRDLPAWQSPGFAHGPRWQTTAALMRLLSKDLRAATLPSGAVERLLSSLPPEFSRWSPLSQDQYLEVRTLLSGYLLSSQGDRVLMAHSVEGRHPFLDPSVVALANSLPASYKLHVLDEKHVLKRASRGLVAPEIIGRTKQPYRAPDALSFVGAGAPDWIDEVMSERAIREASVFDPTAAALLWDKCRAKRGDGQLSNADNMAVVGMLSTQLLYQHFVREAPPSAPAVTLETLVDDLGEH